MERQNLVAIRPTQIKKIKYSALARQIHKNTFKRKVVYQDQYEKRILRWFLIRLYHIAYTENTIHKFPFSRDEYTDKDGFSSERYKDFINVKKAFENVKKTLTKQGFECIVSVEKKKYERGYDFAKLDYRIEVVGLLE